jgi:hypothetical protein
LCGDEEQNPGPVHAGQVLYHWATPPAPGIITLNKVKYDNYWHVRLVNLGSKLAFLDSSYFLFYTIKVNNTVKQK